ncbi:DUF7144 family membrane protein [Gordonia sp. NPDC003424]
MSTYRDEHPVKEGIAGGATLGAAALLLVAGIVGLLQGISAVANDDLFVAGPQYIYKLDLTSWGWIHILLGVIAIVVAFGMFAAATWARVAAILIASLSIIANFLWLPYYPWWSVLLIALDILIIWAVATWRTA